MLRRYAAGSILGSGGGGRVMSWSDGEVNADPFPLLGRGGDLRELFEDFVPFELIESPLADSLPFFRLNRPILRRTIEVATCN